jgi:hypothetical protein
MGRIAGLLWMFAFSPWVRRQWGGLTLVSGIILLTLLQCGAKPSGGKSHGVKSAVVIPAALTTEPRSEAILGTAQTPTFSIGYETIQEKFLE